MSERTQDPLKKSEIKWWWPVLILAASFAAMWGALRYEVTTCSVEIDAIQAKQDQTTVDRILIESRLTRIETKLDSILQALVETH